MTPRERSARITELREELRRPSMATRGKRRGAYERELIQLVTDRMRENLRSHRTGKKFRENIAQLSLDSSWPTQQVLGNNHGVL